MRISWSYYYNSHVTNDSLVLGEMARLKENEFTYRSTFRPSESVWKPIKTKNIIQNIYKSPTNKFIINLIAGVIYMYINKLNNHCMASM